MTQHDSAKMASAPEGVSETGCPLGGLASNLRALQLRCLIANDLALIDHYSDQLAGEDGIVEAAQISDAQHEATLTKLGDTIRRAQRRRAALEAISPAAPQSSQVGTVTPDAVQPATSS